MPKERFHSGATCRGRMVDSHLKDHLNLPAPAQGSYRDREERAFVPIQLSFLFLASSEPYLFIFLAFRASDPIHSYFWLFQVGLGPIHSYFWLSVCSGKNRSLPPSWTMCRDSPSAPTNSTTCFFPVEEKALGVLLCF